MAIGLTGVRHRSTAGEIARALIRRYWSFEDAIEYPRLTDLVREEPNHDDRVLAG
jgi:hypothetical protein